MSGGSAKQPFQNAANRTGVAKVRQSSAAFSIRFTEEERARLRRDAGRLSLAAHIRRKLFDDTPPSPPRMTKKRRTGYVDREPLARLLGALGQSGLHANLHRIANAAEIGALAVTPELIAELEAACRAVRAMRRDLVEAIGLGRTSCKRTSGARQ